MDREPKPKSPQVILAEGKRAFRQGMFGNDTFFSLVQRRLHTEPFHNMDLTDFDCEPTVQGRVDGNENVGIRNSIYRVWPTNELGYYKRQAKYDYINLGVIDPRNNHFTASEELIAEVIATLPDGQRGKRKTATENAITELFDTWQTNYRNLVQPLNGQIEREPLTNIIVLRSF